jgi:hypothetical protein
MASKYMILQGDGRVVQGQLDKFAAEGYVPILYSTQLVGAENAGRPGIINHCVIVEKKEGK